MVLAAVRARDQMLAAILDPAHRMAAAQGEPCERHLLGQQDALVAEAAAHVGGDDAHLAMIEAQAFRKPGAHDVRHLAGGIEGELFEPGIPPGDHAAALDRRHGLARGANFARHLDRRVQRLGDVDFDRSFEKDIVAPMFVHQRAARRARRQHVVHGRQLVEIERDGTGDVLGLRARRRHAHGDQLADMANLVGCERRLFRDLEALECRTRHELASRRQGPPP